MKHFLRQLMKHSFDKQPLTQDDTATRRRKKYSTSSVSSFDIDESYEGTSKGNEDYTTFSTQCSSKDNKWSTISTTLTTINSSDSLGIGIDLGTKNCCVAVYFNNNVQIVKNSLSKNTTPSYICFEKDGTRTIGKTAKEKAYKQPEDTIFDSKRMIGRYMNDRHLKKGQQLWPFVVSPNPGKKTPMIETRGFNYKPEEISSYLIRHCVEMAERHLNQAVTKAVITVPAYFNDNQKQATVEAGKMAGVEVLTILNEPTAAAIAYKLKRINSEPQKVLIFDLGGGTFDVAVVDLGENQIKVVGIGGDAFLGGEEFDEEIVNYCIDAFKENTGNDLLDESTNDNIPRTLCRLREEVEKRKIDLDCTSAINITVDCIIGQVDLDIELTREKYEEIIEPLIARMIDIVRKTLNECNLKKEHIDDIILVGASTKTPLLQTMLSKFFNEKSLNISIDPDEAVAFGAAVQAAFLTNEDIKRSFEIVKIIDVVSMSIGIKVRASDKNDFSVIIPKNPSYPANFIHPVHTSENNQTKANICIYQGENKMVSENVLLGEFVLDGIPRNKATKERIDVHMDLDKMGLLRVTATCASNKKSKFLDVKILHQYGNDI